MAAYVKVNVGGKNTQKRGIPPPGYICHRCNIPGHWIQNCPTKNAQVVAGLYIFLFEYILI